MTVAGTYNPYLVALSFAVACFASYTALDLGGRIRASHGWARRAWLATAALAMGGGIWSMHFIAMLAFLHADAGGFDIGLTVLSLLVAIARHRRRLLRHRHAPGDAASVGHSAALSWASASSRCTTPAWPRCACRRISATTASWSRSRSLIAIGASIAALWLAFRTAVAWQRMLAADRHGLVPSRGCTTPGWRRRCSHDAHPRRPGARRRQPRADRPRARHRGDHLRDPDPGAGRIGVRPDSSPCLRNARPSSCAKAKSSSGSSIVRRRFRCTWSEPDGRIEKVSDTWLYLLGYTRDGGDRPQADRLHDRGVRSDRTTQIVWPSLQRGGRFGKSSCSSSGSPAKFSTCCCRRTRTCRTTTRCARSAG